MPTKIERILGELDRQELGDELERRWTADGDQSMSLRELADWFNKQLLAVLLDHHGFSYLPGEVDNIYRLLTDDDVSSGDRTQVRRTLERDGVDVGDLRQYFVSHQAVHTYLSETRGVTPPTTDESTLIEGSNEQIRQLINRLTTVTSDAIDRHRSKGRIDLTEYSVLATVTVTCEACGTIHDIDDLFENRGCDCHQN